MQPRHAPPPSNRSFRQALQILTASFTPPISETKREQQFRREKDAVASAVKYFCGRLGAPPEEDQAKPQKSKADPANARAPRKRPPAKPEYSETGWAMLRQHWSRLADAIRKEQNTLKKPGSRITRDGHLLLFLDADSLAVITLQCVIGEFGSDFSGGEELAEELEEKIGEEVVVTDAEGDDDIERASERRTNRRKQTALARKIGERCRQERDVMPRANIKSGMKRCLEKYPEHRRKAERNGIKKIVFGDWSDDERAIPFGVRLLRVAAESAIVTVKFEKEPGENDAYRVELTDTFSKDFVKCRDAKKHLLTPKYRPMVVPPNPWTVRLDDGGYLNNKHLKVRSRTHLVIHRGDPQMITVLKKGDFTRVLSAVNAIQDTKWRINRKIYDVMLSVQEMRWKKQLTDLSLKERQRLAHLHEQGRETVSVLQQRCDICADIKDEEAIYFPHRLDYRGRAYPLPHAVHPQADDPGRSLLQFGDGKPLGKSGEQWLAIHLANARGEDAQDGVIRRLDKASFEDRVQWTMDNSEKIVRSAREPLKDHWWMHANKPWRFLAACFEWEAYLSDKKGFVSHLPITIDGTCNGLQHLSALRLDEGGAKETNLMPGEQPADIYETVAADVLSELADIAENEGHKEKEEASMWHWRKLVLPPVKSDPDPKEHYLIIHRDACKLAVMTTPYGVTEKGIQQQLFENAISRPMRKRAMYSLTTEEIRRPRAFVTKLGDSKDLLSRFLWDSFSEDERKAISRLDAAPNKLKELLASALNGICNGGLIFEAERFSGIKLSPEAEKLVAVPGKLYEKVPPQSATDRLAVDAEEWIETMKGRTIRRVNRLLLEDAFPDKIKRTQNDRWACCGYLAKKLSEHIDRLVDPGKTVPKWFRSVASAMVKSGHGVCWTAPSGFPVLQESWELDKDEISAGLIEVVIYTRKEPAVRDVSAQERKIVANFIHSLDAAHLTLTICRLHSEELRHFGVVHDCFAVHACDVDQLREEFVGMYRIPQGGHSLLEKFQVAQPLVAKKELDPPPPRGNFDIERVLESEYFFC